MIKWTVAITLSLTMSACAQTTTIKTAAPSTAVAPGTASIAAAAPPATVATRGDHLVSPLNSWFGGNEHNGRGAKDEEDQVATCMGQKGLTWIPLETSAGEPETRLALETFRRTYGYGGHGTGRSPSKNPNADAMKLMDPKQLADYLDALEGPVGADGRSGGCRGKARAERLTRQKVRSNDSKAIGLWNEMTTDSRYTEALKEWSACMTAAGFAGLQTTEDAKFLGSTSAVIDTELAVAAADLACSKAHLWDVLLELGNAAVAQLGP